MYAGIKTASVKRHTPHFQNTKVLVFKFRILIKKKKNHVKCIKAKVLGIHDIGLLAGI